LGGNLMIERVWNLFTKGGLFPLFFPNI
jgi:hypothetical protein